MLNWGNTIPYFFLPLYSDTYFIGPHANLLCDYLYRDEQLLEQHTNMYCDVTGIKSTKYQFVINIFKTGELVLTQSRTIFPFPYLSRARRTPSLSTKSGLSLRPAVSLSRMGNPPMSSAVSTMSLVVPAMGDTMAAGLWPGCKIV